MTKAKPPLSIVTITLNEEKRLPILLKSIERAHIPDIEVIVADAHSTDRTRAIAKEMGARVVDGGLPSVGRNAGARAAKSEYILFLDSDVTVTPGFLKENLAEMQRRDLRVATTYSKTDSGDLLNKGLFGCWNAWIWLVQRWRPHAPGYCIFTTADIHERIGGFDERLKFAEDVDYVDRAARFGKFGILPHPIVVSDRRYHKGNRLKTIGTLLSYEFHHIFSSRSRYKEYEYSFGDHPEQRKK